MDSIDAFHGSAGGQTESDTCLNETTCQPQDLAELQSGIRIVYPDPYKEFVAKGQLPQFMVENLPY